MTAKSDLHRAPQTADIIPWPDGVTALTGISAPTLQRGRARGDSPKLYAVTERSLVTTGADLLDWVRAKAVPPGYKCRPSTRVKAQEAAS